MGCDGGTIPKRDELVKVKKKPEQKDKASELSFKWNHCAITQQPLQTPIVACMLGRLYSKDSVIEALLDRSKMPTQASHLKTLKDIKGLNLTKNPSFKSGAETGDGYIDRQTAEYICPTIGLEMNGKFKFCFSWKCGCVVSERALKEVKDNICHKCQEVYNDEDIVVLNPEKEDLELMNSRMETRMAKMKAEKKAKKGNKAAATTSTGGECSTQSTDNIKPEDTSTTCKDESKPESSKKGETTKTKRKNVIVPSGAQEIEDPDFKKAKSTYSVAKDDNASKVYKSLFTSSNKAKEQNRAHWITYNPFYN